MTTNTTTDGDQPTLGPDTEALGVLENVLGSMLGSMEGHLKKPEKRKRPKPEAYAKILLGDLQARGWRIVRP